MKKPVWLLDIDGVVNAVAHLDGMVNTKVMGFPINYSPKVIEFIKAVHADERAEIRWHTTWQESARSKFAPAVGLPDFPVADNGPRHDGAGGRGWWKDRAAHDVVFVEGRPLLWTDDDLNYMSRHSPVTDSPKTRELAKHPNARLISPLPGLGLTDANMVAAMWFIDYCAAEHAT